MKPQNGLSKFFQLFDLGVKGQMNVMMVCDTHVMAMHLQPKYHWPILKGNKIKTMTNSDNYLTMGSKMKPTVKWMSWWYVTHCLPVMQIQSEYAWPFLKGKEVMARITVINYLTLGQRLRSNVCRDGISSNGDAPTYQIAFTYLERQKTNIAWTSFTSFLPLGQRSRSNVCYNGM